MKCWQIAIDTGGTFTDCLAIDPEGASRRLKVPSSGWMRGRVVDQADACTLVLAEAWDTSEDLFRGGVARADGETRTIASWQSGRRRLVLDNPFTRRPGTIEIGTGEEVPVLATRILTGTPIGEPFPALSVRLATTKATNALLENKVAPTVLLTTAGFRDLLEIGDQRRPDLFALRHRKPPAIHAATIEVDGRMDASGSELVPLGTAMLDAEADKLRNEGMETAAVAFANSYANPDHEAEAERVLRRAGFEHVSCSSATASEIRLVPRARTAVADACLAPIMRKFVDDVAAPVGERSLLMMTSAGGLESASAFRPVDSLLSGPAGGVAGAAAIARAAGFERFIAFDMGGTSTDVSRFDGDFIYQFEQAVGSAKLLAPALRIETVAAGGGSICALKPSGLSVGPESAGADPGPACYGKGGPLAITDVNLLLDRLDPERVSIPIDRAASRSRLEELRAAMREAGLEVPDERALLEGLLEIAVERMADAIRRISLREGYDPADFALVAFGGAGPQHACAVAEKLGIREILIPGDAGLLSAFGLQEARIERFASKQVLAPLADLPGDLPGILQSEALARLREEGLSEGSVHIRRQIAEVRLAGQDTPLNIDFERAEEIEEKFRARYREIFGYPAPEDKETELVSLRVIASTRSAAATPENFEESCRHQGPMLLQDGFSTLWLANGWDARKGMRGTLLLRSASSTASVASAAESKAVESELYRHRLAAVVENMGALLQRTAISTNVKERADFSCALLDAEGMLVMNAPHIPVHLGALGLCVREVARHFDIGPDDMVVTNHPAFGGSHLPDITVISAAFDESGKRLAYVANRAHHAEIGGTAPGSMPPDAQTLAEEGVVIEPRYLLRNGEPRFDEIESLLTDDPFPTRCPGDNLADLRAQAAANHQAVRALADLPSVKVREHMEHILTQSETAFRKSMSGLLSARATEKLDDGTAIAVSVRLREDHVEVDFEGTSGPAHPGNLNATPAIVRSALLYVLRLQLQEDVPLNEGILRNVAVHLPECFLNPRFSADPAQCPAVVGGNVETSQRLVDTLVKALGLQACSQGTMNNLLFGNETFGYYETIGGGAGAGDGYDGADALHTHMTNTAITDIEILEARYPVRVREFGIRSKSGGSGKWRGGNGIVREMEFLAPLRVSLVTQHRGEAPFGVFGGDPGSPGRQTLTRADGTTNALDGMASIAVLPGDILRIETPGGGGYGASNL